MSRIILLFLFFVAQTAGSQGDFQQSLERELEIIERIEAEASVNGPRSENLIGLLEDLQRVYEQMGNIELANETTQRLLEVIRANYGLHSLQQAPVLRQLMSREEERENPVGVWELEQDLLNLVRRNRTDPRGTRILRDAADRRLEVLNRYTAGEFPPEIVLGCYYAGSYYTPDARLRGSRPMASASSLRPNDFESPVVVRNCMSGSSSTVRKSILSEALSMYTDAAIIARRNEGLDTGIRELLSAIIVTSYRLPSYDSGRAAYEVLLDLETASEPLRQAEVLVQRADWDLFFSYYLGSTPRDLARAGYADAARLLAEHGTPEPASRYLFAPELPVILPSFRTNPLDTRDAANSGRYIDVSFVISGEGKTDDIEIVDTAGDVRRAEQRDLVQLIRRSRFRPGIGPQGVADSTSVSVRHHLD